MEVDGQREGPRESTPVVRRVRITQDMIRRHGGTEGCQGCRAFLKGQIQSHSEKCRTRIEAEEAEGGNDMQKTFEDRRRRTGEVQAEREGEIEENKRKQEADRERRIKKVSDWIYTSSVNRWCSDSLCRT